MAKAYFTQNKRIGSVGGSVYSVVKGQCIERAKPVSVANPRTDAQMTQRTQFLSAVRFYQRATQRFFKFAFEGKKSVESDYNAFMRLNAKVGGFITKAQGDAVGFPMIAPFIVTQGSMVAPAYGLDSVLHGTSNYSQMIVGDAPGGASNLTTIGEVSAAILQAYPSYRSGDIVTMVSLYSSATGEFYNDLDAKSLGNEAVRWDINQIILDTTDESLLVNAGLSCSVVEGKYVLEHEIGPRPVLCGCAVVVSRNEASGLKVSTARISLSPSADAAYEEMRSASHLQQVLSWWGAQQQAILQGGAAVHAEPVGGTKILAVNASASFPVNVLYEMEPDGAYGIQILFDGAITKEEFESKLTSDLEGLHVGGWDTSSSNPNMHIVNLNADESAYEYNHTFHVYYNGVNVINLITFN